MASNEYLRPQIGDYLSLAGDCFDDDDDFRSFDETALELFRSLNQQHDAKQIVTVPTGIGTACAVVNIDVCDLR